MPTCRARTPPRETLNHSTRDSARAIGQRRSGGFTLLELLLVLVVAAVILGLVGLSVRPPADSERTRVRTEVQQEVARLHRMARLNQDTLGLQWYQHGLQAYRVESDTGNADWRVLRVSEWELREPWEFVLWLDDLRVGLLQAPGAIPAPDSLHLVLNPDGTSSRAWRLGIRRGAADAPQQQLTGDGLNPPFWQTVPEGQGD